MKIAHVGPSTLPVRLNQGGAVQRRMIELAAAQALEGDEVLVYSAETGREDRLDRDVQVVALPTRLPRPWRDYEFLLSVARHLRRQQIDVVHVHNSPEGARMLRRLDRPSVLSFDWFRFRLTRTGVGRAHNYRSLAAFDMLLPVSDACREEFAAFWPRSPAPTSVLYNGVCTEQFKPDPEAGAAVRARLGIGYGPVLLYVGRLCPQKGTDLLLTAWEQLRKRIDDVSLVLAGPLGQFGSKHRDDPLVERASQLGARWLGPVSEGLLAPLLNACDVFVMPTREHEMFGMAALEAEACGKPVIASRCGGLVEVVSEASGLFFTPGRSDELHDAMYDALSSAELRSEKAQAAVQHADQFSWPRLAARASTLYQAVAA